MKKFAIAICAVLALAAVTPAHAAEYKYVFVPASTDDGSPLSDWGGTLFLDASSSSGGSLSDINLSASFLTTEFGTFNLNQASVSIFPITGTFSWTPSAITSMDIMGFVTLEDTDYNWVMTQSSVAALLPDPTATGTWVASTSSGVPDSASTAMLIGLASAGLLAFGAFGQRRQVALVRCRK